MQQEARIHQIHMLHELGFKNSEINHTFKISGCHKILSGKRWKKVYDIFKVSKEKPLVKEVVNTTSKKEEVNEVKKVRDTSLEKEVVNTNLEKEEVNEVKKVRDTSLEKEVKKLKKEVIELTKKVTRLDKGAIKIEVMIGDNSNDLGRAKKKIEKNKQQISDLRYFSEIKLKEFYSWKHKVNIELDGATNDIKKVLNSYED